MKSVIKHFAVFSVILIFGIAVMACSDKSDDKADKEPVEINTDDQEDISEPADEADVQTDNDAEAPTEPAVSKSIKELLLEADWNNANVYSFGGMTIRFDGVEYTDSDNCMHFNYSVSNTASYESEASANIWAFYLNDIQIDPKLFYRELPGKDWDISYVKDGETVSKTGLCINVDDLESFYGGICGFDTVESIGFLIGGLKVAPKNPSHDLHNASIPVDYASFSTTSRKANDAVRLYGQLIDSNEAGEGEKQYTPSATSEGEILTGNAVIDVYAKEVGDNTTVFAYDSGEIGISEIKAVADGNDVYGNGQYRYETEPKTGVVICSQPAPFELTLSYRNEPFFDSNYEQVESVINIE